MKVTTIPWKEYIITTDKNLLNAKAAHQWLSLESYWSKYIPLDVVEQAYENSFVIGILHEGKQVAYGRLITDYATFAHLADVYVLKEHRGKGLSKKMMEVLMDMDWVKKLRNISLGTLDAHTLYEKFGFSNPSQPERVMHLSRPDIYNDPDNPCR